MIERRKLSSFSDLAAASVLLIKYRALAKLVRDRERYLSVGHFKLEGPEREERRVLQLRLARQFPGSLAELEHLSETKVSDLIGGLRCIVEGQTKVDDECRSVLHAVVDYHLALHLMMVGDESVQQLMPRPLRETDERGGSSRRVGRWVREKYGLGKRCRVWIFDIGWVRGG